MTDFVNILDNMIKEFEEYRLAETELNKKILLTAIIAKLYNLRTVYMQRMDY